MVRISIRKMWSTEWSNTNILKIKEHLGKWETSCNENRLYEVVTARLRVNCTRNVHLIPRMERNYPLKCDCENNVHRLTLKHILFKCSKYNIQRENICKMLIDDDNEINLKNLFSDNNYYINEVIEFLKNIDMLKEI